MKYVNVNVNSILGAEEDKGDSEIWDLMSKISKGEKLSKKERNQLSILLDQSRTSKEELAKKK